MAKRISPAGWRLLEELAEPNKNPDNWWSVPRSWLRSARPLIRQGLVRVHEESATMSISFGRVCLCLTAEGREQLKEPHG